MIRISIYPLHAAFNRECGFFIAGRYGGKELVIRIIITGADAEEPDNASLVSPREIMKAAILSNASAFIAVHNHPSGNCSPSSEDIETTKRLAECGEILDIRMLDHIIVAGETGKMLSMKAEGSMPDIRKKDWER